MSSTNTPNMALIVPTVGGQPGPQYAQDINNDLQTLDQHDHSAGKGVQITPAGMNINTALTFNSNFANDLAGLALVAQGVTPAISTIYQSGTDLYYVDGLGNNVRITQAGGVAGSPGSISNLNSPASAAYVSGSQTFVWQSGASIAANMDFGSAIMRNLSPNSTYALTLAPPNLTSNYTLTLPTIPAAASFMTMDNAGNMGTQALAATLTTANLSASANIVGTQLSGSANILGTQLSASAAIKDSQLAATNKTITSGTTSFTTSSLTFTSVPGTSGVITSVGRPVQVTLQAAVGNVSCSIRVIQGTAGTFPCFATYTITRNGTAIARFDIGDNPSGALPIRDLYMSPAVIQVLDYAAPAGANTYEVQCRVSSGGTPSTVVANALLSIVEL